MLKSVMNRVHNLSRLLLNINLTRMKIKLAECNIKQLLIILVLRLIKTSPNTGKGIDSTLCYQLIFIIINLL